MNQMTTASKTKERRRVKQWLTAVCEKWLSGICTTQMGLSEKTIASSQQSRGAAHFGTHQNGDSVG